mmetsp:Transcript_29862/g.79447  ORF Transcript_29862/g.79447 Transcript_29862/m.79447 type:complete len:117 (-) Transcript_29862:304-654(-)
MKTVRKQQRGAVDHGCPPVGRALHTRPPGAAQQRQPNTVTRAGIAQSALLLSRTSDQPPRNEVRGAGVAVDLPAEAAVVPPTKGTERGVTLEAHRALGIGHPSRVSCLDGPVGDLR